MRASSGFADEPLTNTLGMAGEQDRSAETWSAQVHHDVHGQFGHQDGVGLR